MDQKGRNRCNNGHNAEEHVWGEQLLLAKNRSLKWVWWDLTPIPTSHHGHRLSVRKYPLYHGNNVQNKHQIKICLRKTSYSDEDIVDNE